MSNNGFGHKRFVKDETLAAQEVIDEMVLVPLRGDTDRAYIMNEVAGRIWTLIDGQRQMAEITQAITDEFNVDAAQAAADAQAFTEKLEKLGFIWPA